MVDANNKDSTPHIMECDCGNNLMTVSRRKQCYDCECNGVYNKEKERWEYPETLLEGQEREEAMIQGECEHGSCGNAGCLWIECSVCHKLVEYIPMYDL